MCRIFECGVRIAERGMLIGKASTTRATTRTRTIPWRRSKMVYPDGGGSDLDGLAVDLGFDHFGGWVEDEDLGLAAAGPEAVDLAVHAFEPGELRCQFLEPFAFGSQRSDTGD